MWSAQIPPAPTSEALYLRLPVHKPSQQQGQPFALQSKRIEKDPVHLVFLIRRISPEVWTKGRPKEADRAPARLQRKEVPAELTPLGKFTLVTLPPWFVTVSVDVSTAVMSLQASSGIPHRIGSISLSS
ncbi:hypothetical protein PoB_005602000 [Plakobranchus ocellatus]|uniref:Uncharacterized protein n=1 Tax=Plakobranchus ocellatus TaxID=259542 RepID=A0AAV4C9X7_9GAST|nr:hypothetical protein PoB_005602000 [Plakobranchus ocellatus]